MTASHRRAAVWCPKCRPPRRKTLKTGCCVRSGLCFGHNGACRGVLFARKPLNMRVHPLMRTSTPRYARGRRCPRAYYRVNVRMRGPTRMPSGPRAGERDQVCNGGAGHGFRARRRRGLALSARWPGCLKPPSPLRAGEVGQLKPPSPLRVRNGRFWRVFRAQR